MKNFPILTFEPQFKSVIWGGDRIARFKGLPSQGDTVGESWELSCVPGHESVIAAGPFKGQPFNEVLAAHTDEIMGERLAERYGTEFPLLIKLIDSADDLSVQVHPDDTLARKRHNCPGKTEMWISVDPAEGAYLYSGFNREITPDEFRRRIADNTLTEVLGKYNPAKGDVFFLPAGRVHSIGKGNFVLEIQQTSDITYRIYDYDRRDAHGNPRQLHIEESMEAVDFADTAGAAPTHISGKPDLEETIADSAYFTTTFVDVADELSLELAARDSFTILIAIEGDALLTAPDGTTATVRQGYASLIPASMPRVTVKGPCKVVTTYIR
ncbi:MAG: class I mannose-6-phosphate isomerase [Paramuribaculum sp.]|nr:class I mannose-6-phosphate isomerase [Paramuribaculum sp.]